MDEPPTAKARGVSPRRDLMDDIPDRRGVDGERRRKWAFLDRNKAKTDNRGDREDRQGGDLRPRRLQMHRSDGELRQEPQEQKGRPPDLVRTVAGELNPGLSQGVQFQREVEPGSLHGQAAATKNRGGGNSLDEVVESGFRFIGAASMQISGHSSVTTDCA